MKPEAASGLGPLGSPRRSVKALARALASIAPLVVTLACGGASAGSGGSETPESAAPKDSAEGSGHALVGAPAPDFKLPAQGGNGSVSPSAFAGKVVIVDFWATWCKPCRESFPYYQSLAKRHNSDVVVLAVSVDDEADGIAAFVADTGVTFPIGWDQEKSVVGRYEPKSMPSSFIIDRNGVIRYVHEGFRAGDSARIDAMVAELLQ